MKLFIIELLKKNGKPYGTGRFYAPTAAANCSTWLVECHQYSFRPDREELDFIRETFPHIRIRTLQLLPWKGE